VLPSLTRWFSRRTPEPATRRLGRSGERLAARTLKKAGYRILGRNLRVPMGEADLLCLAPDRRTIVLVEVKTRIHAPPGGNPAYVAPPPEANVDADKRAKLRLILRHLARANGWQDRPCRIDVVAIDWPADGREPVVRHHVNAV
jgi:putative endonuclease